MKLIHEDYIFEQLPKLFTPYHLFAIMQDRERVGTLTFREGTDDEHYYDGHIGYHIDEAYRGHHYAYQACLSLKPFLLAQGLDHVILTCDPDNVASVKTIERLGATYLETRAIPQRLRRVFTPDEHEKRIYRWEVKDEADSLI